MARPVCKPLRNLTFGSPAVAESAGFQWIAGPVRSVWVLRAQLFILFKVEKFLPAADMGFVMIFSRLCECQVKRCLRTSCGWMIVETGLFLHPEAQSAGIEHPTQTSTFP